MKNDLVIWNYKVVYNALKWHSNFSKISTYGSSDLLTRLAWWATALGNRCISFSTVEMASREWLRIIWMDDRLFEGYWITTEIPYRSFKSKLKARLKAKMLINVLRNIRRPSCTAASDSAYKILMDLNCFSCKLDQNRGKTLQFSSWGGVS